MAVLLQNNSLDHCTFKSGNGYCQAVKIMLREVIFIHVHNHFSAFF